MNPVVVYIVRRDDKVLLVKRAQQGQSVSPWVFPADILPDDEVASATAQSVQDLLGFSPSDVTIVKERDHGPDASNAYYVAMQCHGDLDTAVEITETKWVTPGELVNDVDADVDDDVIQYLKR